jgi:hypothetical protein
MGVDGEHRPLVKRNAKARKLDRTPAGAEILISPFTGTS